MGTYTPNLGLYKPDVGEVGWGDKVNENWDKIDEKVTALEGLKIVKEIVVDSDTDTVVLDELDINKHRFYILIISMISSGGYVHCYANDNFDNTDYVGRYTWEYNGYSSSGGRTGAVILDADVDAPTQIVCIITLDPAGHYMLRAEVVTTYAGFYTDARYTYRTKSTMDNLTKLVLKGSRSNSFRAGTKIVLLGVV